MAAKESILLKDLQLIFTKLGHRLFRNSVGSAYQGETHRLKNGDVIIKHPRLIQFGLQKGSGDLIGFTKKTITRDMVGHDVLIFTNVEAKTKNISTTKEQSSFHEFILKNGGISIIVKSITSEAEIEKTIHDFRGLERS